MKRLTSFLVFSILLITTVRAQDPHFSQYFNAGMLINPSLAGKGVEDTRISSVYRSQWWGSDAASFKTMAISAEKSLALGNGGHSTLGFGGYLVSDQSNNGILKNNYLSITSAYNIALDAQGKSQLGVGLQGVYANRMLDNSKMIFQSQFGSMGYQRLLPSDDAVDVASNSYWDVNAGVNYSQRLNNWGFNLGAAFFHFAKPRDGVYENSQYYIQSRVGLQAGLQFYLRNHNSISISSSIEIQGKNNVTAVGAVYRMAVNDSANTLHLNIGMWNRFGDALTPYVGLEYKSMMVSVSYDIVTSSVRNVYNGVQSMELGFAVKIPSVKATRNSVKPIIQF